MIELRERSAAGASCRELGPRLSRHQGIAILAPIAVALDPATSRGEVGDLASRQMAVHYPAFRLLVDVVPGRTDLLDICPALGLVETAPGVQAAELAPGVIVNGVRPLAQAEFEPLLILLPHARSALASAYAQALGVACPFGYAKTAARLLAADLLRPRPGGDATLRKLAQQSAEAVFNSPDVALAGRVRPLVAQLLGTGRATHEVIARVLAVHPRTMQRRLGKEGTTFGKIKDEVRRALFKTLIGCPQAPLLSAIAGLLDYADASVLTRSCRRWFGASPSAIRRRSLQSSDG
jgi:AraC-like DNA-binding protein